MCPRVTPVKLPARVAGGFLYYKVCSVLLKFYVTFRVCLTGRLQSPSTSKSMTSKRTFRCLPPLFTNLATRLQAARSAGPPQGWTRSGQAWLVRATPRATSARAQERWTRSARVCSPRSPSTTERSSPHYSSYCHGSTMALIAMALLTMALPTVAPLTVAPPTITRLTIARSS